MKAKDVGVERRDLGSNEIEGGARISIMRMRRRRGDIVSRGGR